jgi:hypothetical protein
VDRELREHLASIGAELHRLAREPTVIPYVVLDLARFAESVAAADIAAVQMAAQDPLLRTQHEDKNPTRPMDSLDDRNYGRVLGPARVPNRRTRQGLKVAHKL